MARRFTAELVGTFILFFVGIGAAFVGLSGGVATAAVQGPGVGAGVLGAALGSGLTLIAVAYAFGPISGAHVNPAVTLGYFASGRIKIVEALVYWAGQIVGAFLAAGLIHFLHVAYGLQDRTSTGLITNSYQLGTIEPLGAFIVELSLTFVFVLVVLLVTERTAMRAVAGVAVGVAYAAVYLVDIPVTGAGVNPARSLGAALWHRGDSLPQVWLFVVAPLLGGLVASVFWRFLRVDPEQVVDEQVQAGSAAPVGLQVS